MASFRINDLPCPVFGLPRAFIFYESSPQHRNGTLSKNGPFCGGGVFVCNGALAVLSGSHCCTYPGAGGPGGRPGGGGKYGDRVWYLARGFALLQPPIRL